MAIIPENSKVPEHFYSKHLKALKPRRRQLILQRLDRVSQNMSLESVALSKNIDELRALVYNGKRITFETVRLELPTVRKRIDDLWIKFNRLAKLGAIHFENFSGTTVGGHWSSNPIEGRAHYTWRKLMAIEKLYSLANEEFSEKKQ